MWSHLFRRHGRRATDASPAPDSVEPPAPLPARHPRWTGVGDEIEAFLAGRLAEHLIARDRAVPPWVALNRSAHGTHDELLLLLESEDPGVDGWTPPWLPSERLFVLRLLGSVTGPDDVRALQEAVCVPLELTLTEQCKTDAFTVYYVFDAAAAALDRYLSTR